MKLTAAERYRIQEDLERVIHDWAAELSFNLHVALNKEDALNTLRNRLMSAGYRKSEPKESQP